MSRTSAALACALAAALAPAGATAQADPVRGRSLYESRCSACHALDANRAGPSHRGVFGRKAASVPGYDYSESLKRFNVTWSAATLDAWLANPEALVPGQKMGYSVPDSTDRSDLIAYLRSVK